MLVGFCTDERKDMQVNSCIRKWDSLTFHSFLIILTYFNPFSTCISTQRSFLQIQLTQLNIRVREAGIWVNSCIRKRDNLTPNLVLTNLTFHSLKLNRSTTTFDSRWLGDLHSTPHCDPARLRPHPAPCSKEEKYRRVDGACNNLKEPTWGASFTPFRRMLPSDYADGEGGRRRRKGCGKNRKKMRTEKQ